MQSLSEYPEKLNSLGEVQRIIGLSLSKIQVGRNQRGGLPLHKNLLVATVLNKARDLYMQETMYMNYKMMTGHHFGMPASSSLNSSADNSNEEEMEDPPEAEDYEEDSESDAEDECEPRSCDLATPSRTAITASMAYPASTMAAMMMQAAAASAAASSCSNNDNGRLTPINQNALVMQNNMRLLQQNCEPSHQQTSEGHSSHHDGFFSMQGSFQHLHHLSQLHHHHQQQQQQAAMVTAAAAAATVNQQHLQQQQLNSRVAGSDEGFIDDPDCDCDARNFSTLETRVPFQYCYHCAPFQSANGRGPTLVPSPSSCPSSLSSSHNDDEEEDSLSTLPPSRQAESSIIENNFTIYDMDSKSTEYKAPCDEPSSLGGVTKRRRKMSDTSCREKTKRSRLSEANNHLDVETEDKEELSTADEQPDEVFHPAFRNHCAKTTGSNPNSVHGNIETDGIADEMSGNNTTTTTAQQLLLFPNQRRQDPKSEKKKKSTSEDDSDSESDTSSDSGHSSDDLDASSDKDVKDVEDGHTIKTTSGDNLTKLTRTQITAQLQFQLTVR